MEFQKIELSEQILAQGWAIVEIENSELDWWADEMWLLESTWSPVGTRAYLTFLVDPAIRDCQHRKRGEDVWAVGLSSLKPENRISAADSFTLSLNQGWQRQLPVFLKQLGLLRDQNKSL